MKTVRFYVKIALNLTLKCLGIPDCKYTENIFKRTITYRNWKSVDISVLRSDNAKAFDGFTTQDPEFAVESYNSVL